jgi:hypothetical protein
MDQRAVIRFFTLKRPKAREIQTELESVYRPETLALSRVKKWRERFQAGRTDLMNDPRPRRPVAQNLAEAIQLMLRERPFMSCKILCWHLRIGRATCLRILHTDSGLIKFHFHWIPHTFTADQMSERGGYSSQLLAILEQQ